MEEELDLSVIEEPDLSLTVEELDFSRPISEELGPLRETVVILRMWIVPSWDWVTSVT